jgi:translocation and assembly module TamA
MLVATAAASLCSAADTVRYRVTIAAPAPLAKLLESHLDLVRWSTRTDVSETQLRQLVASAPDQAGELLATEGYFSPRIEATQKQGADNVREVHLAVTPGEATRVVSVELKIRGAIEADPAFAQRAQAARNAFGLKPGDVFRQADWAAGKQRATHSLHRKRYAAAAVVGSRADIDPKRHQAKLRIEIDSGPPFTFGAVKIDGLQRYPERVVANVNPIRPGDPYDEEQLLKYQRRLLALGKFASAVVRADVDAASAGRAPILVSVAEAQARRVDAGVGFSTDRGPRAQLQYTDQNFLDRAWRFNARAQVDRLSQEVLANIGLPIEASGWRNGVEAGLRNQDIQGEKRVDGSLTLARTHTVEEYESQYAAQALNEFRELTDGTEDERRALFLSHRWTWNRTDDLLAPRAGWWARLQLGGAVKGIYTDRSFLRATGKGVWLVPVSSFGTLQLRTEFGVVLAETRNNIPAAYLFRTGGDQTVRGYAYESLGVAEGDATVGGRYMGIASAEYVQWITRQWGAAVFYDVGNAVDDLSAFRGAAGYGAGVRWSSPIGALSLDLAYGENTGEWRVHFNVGLTFR